jgi:hypothetical protein
VSGTKDYAWPFRFIHQSRCHGTLYQGLDSAFALAHGEQALESGSAGLHMVCMYHDIHSSIQPFSHPAAMVCNGPANGSSTSSEWRTRISQPYCG